VSHEESPLVGKGRWTLQPKILKNKDFKDFTKKVGCEAMDKLKKMTTRKNSNNPQKILADFLEQVRVEAKRLEKLQISPRQQQIAKLRKDLRRT
ncbi:hypothetical protein L218DRAFT_809604, partial [Marasmius fiardii PR-910]